LFFIRTNVKLKHIAIRKLWLI